MPAVTRPRSPGAERPRPQPSWLSAPFWQAAGERKLVRPYCQRCRQSFFTPQVCCPRCLSDDWVWKPATGRGQVYSFSIVHRAPAPGFEPPYVVATVDLEEGWQMLTNIVGCDPGAIRIGLPVQVTWLGVGDAGDVLPVFEPQQQAGAT